MADKLSKKILIIEDEPLAAEMYYTKLRMEGYDIKQADDGVEGLELALREKPDLILMDVIMPKMSGYATLAKIKQIDELKSIPVIILSNLGGDVEVKKGMDLGAVKYLIKADYTPSGIVTEIKEILGQ